MGAHSLAPGRHRVKPHVVARHIRDNGSVYANGWPGLPFRLTMGLVVAGFTILAGAVFGAVHTVPADAQTAVVTADAPHVVPVALRCSR
jgi:hypothetical protein